MSWPCRVGGGRPGRPVCPWARRAVPRYRTYESGVNGDLRALVQGEAVGQHLKHPGHGVAGHPSPQTCAAARSRGVPCGPRTPAVGPTSEGGAKPAEAKNGTENGRPSTATMTDKIMQLQHLHLRLRAARAGQPQGRPRAGLPRRQVPRRICNGVGHGAKARAGGGAAGLQQWERSNGTRSASWHIKTVRLQRLGGVSKSRHARCRHHTALRHEDGLLQHFGCGAGVPGAQNGERVGRPPERRHSRGSCADSGFVIAEEASQACHHSSVPRANSLFASGGEARVVAAWRRAHTQQRPGGSGTVGILVSRAAWSTSLARRLAWRKASLPGGAPSITRPWRSAGNAQSGGSDGPVGTLPGQQACPRASKGMVAIRVDDATTSRVGATAFGAKVEAAVGDAAGQFASFVAGCALLRRTVWR